MLQDWMQKEKHRSYRCEALPQLPSPTHAICKSLGLPRFAAKMTLRACLVRYSNCTCMGLSILFVSDSPSFSLSLNSFHKMKQGEQGGAERTVSSLTKRTAAIILIQAVNLTQVVTCKKLHLKFLHMFRSVLISAHT